MSNVQILTIIGYNEANCKIQNKIRIIKYYQKLKIK